MSGNILLIHPQKFGDDRGWFMESYSRNKAGEYIGETIITLVENAGQ